MNHLQSQAFKAALLESSPKFAEWERAKKPQPDFVLKVLAVAKWAYGTGLIDARPTDRFGTPSPSPEDDAAAWVAENESRIRALFEPEFDREGYPARPHEICQNCGFPREEHGCDKNECGFGRGEPGSVWRSKNG